MTYIESEIKAKIREVRNTAEPVLDGTTNMLAYYEVKNEHFQWLLEQAEKVESLKSQVHELEAFKNHAEFLLTERQFEYLEEETKKHLEFERN